MDTCIQKVRCSAIRLAQKWCSCSECGNTNPGVFILQQARFCKSLNLQYFGYYNLGSMAVIDAPMIPTITCMFIFLSRWYHGCNYSFLVKMLVDWVYLLKVFLLNPLGPWFSNIVTVDLWGSLYSGEKVRINHAVMRKYLTLRIWWLSKEATV